LSQKQQHALLRDLWIEWPQHRLYPAFVGRPQSILDCGFGTGSWAVDAAIYLPTSTVCSFFSEMAPISLRSTGARHRYNTASIFGRETTESAVAGKWESRDGLVCFTSRRWKATEERLVGLALLEGRVFSLQNVLTGFGSFQIADLNEKTAFPDESFDLVHSRFVSDGIGRFRWPGYLSDIYRSVILTRG
jgi:hypothetical protein